MSECLKLMIDIIEKHLRKDKYIHWKMRANLFKLKQRMEGLIFKEKLETELNLNEVGKKDAEKN